MKKWVLSGIAVVVAAVIALFIIKDRLERKPVPGSVYKSTSKECDKVGYGYKGLCYGNLAVMQKNKNICGKIPAAEIFNRKKCEDYFEGNKK